MSKEKSKSQKSTKKAPAMNAKEKKAAKIAKRDDKINAGKIVMPGSK